MVQVRLSHFIFSHADFRRQDILLPTSKYRSVPFFRSLPIHLRMSLDVVNRFEAKTPQKPQKPHFWKSPTEYRGNAKNPQKPQKPGFEGASNAHWATTPSPSPYWGKIPPKSSTSRGVSWDIGTPKKGQKTRFLGFFWHFWPFLGFFRVFGGFCDRLEKSHLGEMIFFGNYASVAHERPNRRSSIGATIILAVLGFF